MRTTKHELLLAFVLICVAASLCLAQDPQPTTSPDPATVKPAAEAAKPAASPDSAKPYASDPNGTIYFYRIKQFAGSALEPSVFCDNKELARMDNGRYFGVTLTPGEHTCSMGDKQTGFVINVKPGEEYYARINIEIGFWKGHGRLTLMQKEQGAFELKKVKLLGADKVKDRSLVTHFEGREKTP